MSKNQKIYFLGIGGIHMSGLAKMCRLEGMEVFGSDAVRSDITDELESLGINVFIGHKPENIDSSIDLLVYTNAVKPHNPEFMAAKELNIKTINKPALVGLVMEKYANNICVAGSHGKTSTTAMLGETLCGLGLNPTIMNGGIMTRLNTQVHIGRREYFVLEADEYYDAFLEMKPNVGVILNIEHDHTDYFETEEQIFDSFKRFAALIPPDGTLVVNGGLKGFDDVSCKVVTFGSDGADWQAADVRFNDSGSAFSVLYKGENMGTAELSVPGLHNVNNALATLAVLKVLAVPNPLKELKKFTGPARRFQLKKTLNGAKIYDDYAHNPTEISATLSAARNMNPKRVIALLQPHTRGRTLDFLDDFAKSLLDTDKIILVDIFTPAGREEGHINVSSRDLLEKTLQMGGDAVYCASFGEAEERIRRECRDGDLVLIMGAGDCVKINP